MVVDTATGEVAVGAATCINGALEDGVPTLVVGRGAAASQAAGGDASQKLFIYEGFLNGKAPIAILGDLETLGTSFQGRQFGIVDFTHEPVTFTGSGALNSKPSVSGVAGTLRYAIQGNVLTGEPVVGMAEKALLETEGDLGQRMMAAMEAARAMGGDGRCSCATGGPACGSPPPGGFEVSCRSAFVLLARMGDTDGGCFDPGGCAQGDYYLRVAANGPPGTPDPVFVIQDQYDAWRASLQGRADHVLSTAVAEVTRLVADGVTGTDVTVQLNDVEGNPLRGGGATFEVEASAAGEPLLVSVSAVEDLGGGRYRVRVSAGATPGSTSVALRVDEGSGAITLFPALEFEVEPPLLLNGLAAQVSAATGGAVPLVVNAGAAFGGAEYLLLGSAHGTHPGFDLGGTLVPLNSDALLKLTLAEAGGAMLPGTAGRLDASGRAEATLVVPPAATRAWIGLRIHFASLVRATANEPWTVSEPVLFRIVP